MPLKIPLVGDLSSAISILSAMITPAVLILACGSLILTTSNRLTRVVDRVRELAAEVEGLATSDRDEKYITERRDLLFDLLDRSIHRAQLLQTAMTRLYLALAMFVATSVAIGVLALTNVHWAILALGLGFIGAFLMLSATVLMIIESRIGLGSTYAEMNFLWKVGQYHTPAEARQKRRSMWALFRRSGFDPEEEIQRRDREEHVRAPGR
jgi:hypothetical protein